MKQEIEKQFDFDFSSMLCPDSINRAFELVSSKNFEKQEKRFTFPVNGFVILDLTQDDPEYHAKLNITKEVSKK